MPYNVYVDESAGAIVAHFGEQFDYNRDMPTLREEIADALDAQQEPVALVFDLVGAHLSSGDILEGTNVGGRSEKGVLRHEKAREILLVTQDTFLQLAAKGVNSFSFGFIKVRSFANLQEALDYAREQSGVH